MKIKRYTPFIIIFISCFIVYAKLIIQDPVLNWDDYQIVDPLKNLESLTAYSNLLTPDIQPIRDFSILLDIRLSEMLPFSTFHLTNFIIWFFITLIFYKLLSLEEEINRNTALVVTFLFAIHPIFVNSVAWISARKHLLSCFFILSAYLIHLKQKKSPSNASFLEPILYLLSILSNPITILFPLWILFNNRIQKNLMSMKEKTLSIISVIIMFIIGYLNHNYYNSEIYFKQANFVKVLPFFENMYLIPLMYGRYFFNLILPFNLSTMYSMTSVYNIVGFFLFLLFILYSFKNTNRKYFLKHFTFFLFPLSIVTFQITAVFVFDTYLLTPAIGIAFLIVYLVKELNIHIKRRLALILSILFLIKSYSYSNVWLSNTSLWKNTYETQRDSSSIRTYIDALLSSENRSVDYKKIYELIGELSSFQYPEVKIDIFQRLEFLFKKIYDNKLLGTDEKVEAYNHIDLKSYSRFFYLGALQRDKGKTLEACNYFQSSQGYFDERKISYVTKEEITFEIKYCCQHVSTTYCK